MRLQGHVIGICSPPGGLSFRSGPLPQSLRRDWTLRQGRVRLREKVMRIHLHIHLHRVALSALRSSGKPDPTHVMRLPFCLLVVN